MKDQIEQSIEKLASKAEKAQNPIDAQQYAQAVLNLSNALVGIKNIE